MDCNNTFESEKNIEDILKNISADDIQDTREVSEKIVNYIVKQLDHINPFMRSSVLGSVFVTFLFSGVKTIEDAQDRTIAGLKIVEAGCLAWLSDCAEELKKSTDDKNKSEGKND